MYNLRLVFVLLLAYASASHFRYGTFSWKQISGNTVGFTLHTAWRYYDGAVVGGPDYNNGIDFGDGAYDSDVWYISAVIPSQGYFLVDYYVEHNFTSPNNNGTAWYVAFVSCCKILTSNNNAGNGWNIYTFVDLTIASQSPVATTLPLTNVLLADDSIRTFTVPLSVIAPPNTNLSFNLESDEEICGPYYNCTQPPALTIDSHTGVITWNTSGIPRDSLAGLWDVAVNIIAPGSSINLNFFMEIVAVNGTCLCDSSTPCTVATDCGACNDTTCLFPAPPTWLSPVPNSVHHYTQSNNHAQIPFAVTSTGPAFISFGVIPAESSANESFSNATYTSALFDWVIPNTGSSFVVCAIATDSVSGLTSPQLCITIAFTSATFNCLDGTIASSGYACGPGNFCPLATPNLLNEQCQVGLVPVDTPITISAALNTTVTVTSSCVNVVVPPNAVSPLANGRGSVDVTCRTNTDVSPRNPVAQTVDLTVNRVDNNTFSRPVTIAFPAWHYGLTQEDLALYCLAYFVPANLSWVCVDSSLQLQGSGANKMVTGTTTHNSEFSIIATCQAVGVKLMDGTNRCHCFSGYANSGSVDNCDGNVTSCFGTYATQDLNTYSDEDDWAASLEFSTDVVTITVEGNVIDNRELAYIDFVSSASDVCRYPKSLNWTKSLDSSNCKDVYTLTLDWGTLKSQCGFTYSATNTSVDFAATLLITNTDNLGVLMGVDNDTVVARRNTTNTINLKISFKNTITMTSNIVVFAPISLEAALTEQQVPYSSGGSPVCAEGRNGTQVHLACPSIGNVEYSISSIQFASYGTPTGLCGLYAVDSNCHASNSLAAVQAACVGQSSCTVNATNSVFSDACPGVGKQLFIQAMCVPSEPYLHGQISIQTVAQWPYALTLPIVAYPDSGYKTVAVFLERQSCLSDDTHGFCDQSWGVHYVPDGCSVSGQYTFIFPVTCSNISICAVDVETNSSRVVANVRAEDSCTVTSNDVIFTGELSAYIDSGLTQGPQQYFLQNSTAYFQVVTASPNATIAYTEVIYADVDDGISTTVLFNASTATATGTSATFAHTPTWGNTASFHFRLLSSFITVPTINSKPYTVAAVVKVLYMDSYKRAVATKTEVMHVKTYLNVEKAPEHVQEKESVASTATSALSMVFVGVCVVLAVTIVAAVVIVTRFYFKSPATPAYSKL